MKGQPFQLLMRYEDGSEIVIAHGAEFALLNQLCKQLNFLNE